MKIVAIGGSSGGLQAVQALLRGLDPQLPAAVFVVLHTGAQSSFLTPAILSSSTRWPCELARDGDRIRTGRVVIARPDHHLVLKPGRISTPRGPKENGFRPAVDPLFRTAAASYGNRVIGVVLSGGLDAGAYGLMLIKQHGGITLVQDPEEALVPAMPSNAIRATVPHHVGPISHMAEILNRVSVQPAAQGVTTMSEKRGKEREGNRGSEA